MSTGCRMGGLLFVLLGVTGALADQVVLTATGDGQLDRLGTGPYVMTTPPPNGRLFMLRNSSEFHEGYLEYSLASLPSNATVTSASFTYGVNLLTNSGGVYPSLSINLYDGGDGVTTIGDMSKSLVNVAQSQDLTGTGNYTTNFFSALALNERSTYFPSGYVGISLFPRVEARQAGIYSKEFAQAFGYQQPVLTINYSVPEPSSMAVLGLAALTMRRKRRACLD